MTGGKLIETLKLCLVGGVHSKGLFGRFCYVLGFFFFLTAMCCQIIAFCLNRHVLLVKGYYYSGGLLVRGNYLVGEMLVNY